MGFGLDVVAVEVVVAEGFEESEGIVFDFANSNSLFKLPGHL